MADPEGEDLGGLAHWPCVVWSPRPPLRMAKPSEVLSCTMTCGKMRRRWSPSPIARPGPPVVLLELQEDSTRLSSKLSLPFPLRVHLRILDWVAIHPPGDLPNPRTEPRSPALQAGSSPSEPAGKLKNTGVWSPSLLWEIFPTQRNETSSCPPSLSPSLSFCRYNPKFLMTPCPMDNRTKARSNWQATHLKASLCLSFLRGPLSPFRPGFVILCRRSKLADHCP